MTRKSRQRNDTIKPGSLLPIMNIVARLHQEDKTLTGDQLFEKAKYEYDCEQSKKEPQLKLIAA